MCSSDLYLKNYSHNSLFEFIYESHFSNLGITYHAGEDFLDITDGLRAIDETILFLNYSPGDRIGHALALGIDPFEYYKLKNNTLIMSKQDYLDNIAWILSKVDILNISISSTLRNQLEYEFKRVYQEIYNSLPCDLGIYYQSWLLRGDDPFLYYGKDNKDGEKESYSFWNSSGINNYLNEMKIARLNNLVRDEVMKYHFDADAKIKGREYSEFPIYQEYANVINELQSKMRFELAKKHIAIECNPTSNQVIGSYKRYANHPILNFNNSELFKDYSLCKHNPQLSVSINTDDQGVFSTSLENEYALMAIALEKEVDDNGQAKYNKRFIYDYLNQIREMGHEQQFKT